MQLGFIGTSLGSFSPKFPTKTNNCSRRVHRTPTMADKMLHAVYRVGDLPATRKFLETLGMHVLRERDVPSEKYTNVFYGFGPEQKGEHFSLELTYNYGVDSYNVGDGFGHFSVAVDSTEEVVKHAKTAGFKIIKEPTSGQACIEDPTGYCFEVIETKRRDPLCQLMLRVADLESSITFYEAMGMKVVNKNDNAMDNTTEVVMAFDEGLDSTTLKLVRKSGVESYNNGDGYAQIAVSTPDVYKAAENFEKAGIAVARAPGPVPGIGTKICAVRDPDGWKTVLVDADDFEKEFE